jgi:predicted RNA-binding protein YlxR (DUF448 family)
MQASTLDAQTDRGQARGETDGGTSAAAPRRRCLVTRASHPKGGLLRFVVSPDGVLVPDLGEKLPGRGLYVTPDRALLQTAIDKRLFAKAARQAVTVPADLPETVGRLLRQRGLDLVGFANRAGQAVAGFDRAKMWLEQGRCALVIQSRDGAAGGRERLAGLMRAMQEALDEAGPDARPEGLPAGGPRLVELFDQDELGAAFARPSVVHVAVAPGGLARQLASTADQIVSYERAASANKVAARERKAR